MGTQWRPIIGRVLTPGGHLYISCMEGEGSGFETTSFTAGNSMFINYFSESFLTDAFEDMGLTILEQIRQDYPEEDGSITTDMIFILRNDRPVRTGVS